MEDDAAAAAVAAAAAAAVVAAAVVAAVAVIQDGWTSERLFVADAGLVALQGKWASTSIVLPAAAPSVSRQPGRPAWYVAAHKALRGPVGEGRDGVWPVAL